MFNASPTNKKNILTVAVLICVLAASVFIYTRHNQEKFLAHTKLKISEQQTTLSSIAVLTSKDGADTVVDKIIKDCSPENRALFDEQLSNLPKLNGQELVQMEQLFNACGNFFAERKAVMVARLNREYQVYQDLIAIASIFDTKKDVQSYREVEWGNLVAMELQRSDYSTQLVEVQGDIIRALKNGVTIASEEMQVKLVDAQKTKQSLASVTLQIDSLLQEVLDL